MKVEVDFLDEEQTLFSIQLPSVFREVIKAIPGAHWRSKANCWELHVSWVGYISLFNTFKENPGIVFSDKVVEWLNKEYAEHIYPAWKLRTEIEPDFEVSEKLYSGLRPFQQVDSKFLVTAKKALLTNDMGSGKTVASLSAAVEADAFPLLVVTLSSTKYSWANEVKKFYRQYNNCY